MTEVPQWGVGEGGDGASNNRFIEKTFNILLDVKKLSSKSMLPFAIENDGKTLAQKSHNIIIDFSSLLHIT